MMRLFTRALAGALILSGPLGIGAQDAVDGMPGAIVLDSAAVRASSARTLAQFLAGRVPGLGVTHASGARGIAPQMRVRGAAGLVGAAEPTLYVDGVLMREDSYALAERPDGLRPSFLWDLPLDEVESVTVVKGQASGATLEFGAPRGVIFVRTRRPVVGSTRVAAFLEGSSVARPSGFPPNVGATGTTTSGTTETCTLSDQATGDCTLTGSRSWDPLASASPFRTGSGVRGGASASGGLLGGAYRASTVVGRDAAAFDGASGERIDLAVSYVSPASRRLRLAVDARHATSNGLLPEWHGVIRSGLLGEAQDDANGGFQVPLNEIPGPLPLHARRTTVSGSANFPLGLRVAGHIRASLDAATRHSRRVVMVDPPPPPDELQPFTTATEATWTALAVEAGVRAGHSIVGRPAQLRAVVFMNDARSDDSIRYDFPGFVGASSVDLPVKVIGVSASERAWFGAQRQRSLGVGLRATAVSIGEERIGSVSDGGVGRGFAQSVDGSWDIDREDFFPGIGGLDRLTLFAAHGVGTDVEPIIGLAALGMVSAGQFDPGNRPTSVLETEIGARASFRDGLLSADLRLFKRRMIDLPVGRPQDLAPGSLSPHFIVDGLATVEVSGMELGLMLDDVPLGPARLGLSAGFSTAHDRVTSLEAPDFLVNDGTGPSSIVRQGIGLAELMTPTFTWQDANEDGIIDRTEVSVDVFTSAPRGRTRPTRLLSAAADLAWRGLSLGAVLDGQTGHKRYDAVQDIRCSLGTCAELYDSSTPLDEQARAVAARYHQAFAAGVQDAGFVRLREVWVRVALPRTLVPASVGTAHLTLAGHHVATWTSYGGLDPEAGPFIGGSLQGSAIGAQPLLRTWSLRLDLGR